MDPKYQQIIDFIKESGEELVKKFGKIKYIDVKHRFTSEYDLKIERGFEKIVKGFGEGHKLYAEEEHDAFSEANNLWVVDPISGTRFLIEGTKYYSIVATHVQNGKSLFSAVYGPSINEFFVAMAGQGSFLNDKKITINPSQPNPKIIFKVSDEWKDLEAAERVRLVLKTFNFEEVEKSEALNYSNVACGRADCFVLLGKDSFPSFAGQLIVTEAGGVFSNIKGESIINHDDKIFIAGEQTINDKILPLVQKALGSYYIN